MPETPSFEESVSTPSPARMYDYYLGGKDNFQVDRDAGDEVLAAIPNGRFVMRESRAFLKRAVRFVTESGIDQFLDIGTGLPTQENVHEVAQRVNPRARIVYVDYDPIVLAHGRALLPDDETTTIITADMRDPASVLNHPDVLERIDFDRPLGIIFCLMLHFVSDEDGAYDIVRQFRDAAAPGSHLVISHIDNRPEVSAGVRVYDKATSSGTQRSVQEIGRFFDGFELVEPGLVNVGAWRPDHEIDDLDSIYIVGGVGRKI